MDPFKSSPQPLQQEAKLHFLDYWRIIRIRKTIILAVFLLVVITATLVTFILPESFSSAARIKVERDITDIDPISGSRFAPGYDPYFIQTEFEVIQSEVILGKVIEQLDLTREWGQSYGSGEPLKPVETMELLKRQVDLRPTRNTSIIEIRVFSNKPDEAQKLANSIADTYQAHRLGQNRAWMLSGIDALKDRWKQEEEELKKAQEDVDKLRQELQINDPDPMSSSPSPTIAGETLRQLNASLIQAQAKQVQDEVQLKGLKELDKPLVREAIQTAVGADSELGNLLASYNLAQSRLTQLEKTVTIEQGDWKNASKEADRLNTKINERVVGILAGLQTKVEAGKAYIVKLQDTVNEARKFDLETNTKTRPYYEAKQRLEDRRQFRALLNLKISQQETDLRLPKTSMVQIIDRAIANPRAVRPNKPLNIALGVIIGLIVGVGLAFFIEYLDTSVKTIDDVERTLQAPVLGVIPQNVGLLLEEGLDSPHAEAYRVLRTNLLFSRKDDKLNTVAVVSAGAGEGKSTTIFNLATVFAQNGSRVVVVDSDLRRPTLHKMMRVTNNLGLTNYLLKQNTLDEVVQTSNLPNLDFMASGKLPSSSLGVLSSSRMKDLISDLRQRYDFVFFDSPPIMGVSDASILASEVDMTIQVIQYRRYPQPMNVRAKQMIEKVGGNLIGIVLNNINMSQDENYYYYSGYYHEYYSKNEEETAPAAPASGGGDQAKLDTKSKY